MSQEQPLVPHAEPPVTPAPADPQVKVEVKTDPTVQQVDPEPTSPAPDAEFHVHLPAVIADNFGISGSEARRMLMTSTVTVGDGSDNDVLLPRDTINVPLSQIEGKTVTVKGEVKSIRFVYKHTDEA